MKLFAEKESGVYGDYLQNNNFKSVVVMDCKMKQNAYELTDADESK